MVLVLVLVLVLDTLVLRFCWWLSRCVSLEGLYIVGGKTSQQKTGEFNLGCFFVKLHLPSKNKTTQKI
jgi:hypothetical protein